VEVKEGELLGAFNEFIGSQSLAASSPELKKGNANRKKREEQTYKGP